MSAKNDITGDAIASKANSKSYRDNYENIFAKKATEKKVELDGGFVIPKAMTDAEQAVEPVAWLITHPGSQPMECPYPCGWNNLYSIIVQKGAYLAQSTLGDDAITSHQRNEMVRIIDFARTLCEWGKNTRPPKRKPLIECQARLPNGELTSNVYDAFEKGYAQAKIDLADQETVAWIYEQLLADGFSERTLSFGFDRDFDGVITPLYAQPLKRQPLSDDDIAKLWGEKFSGESEMLRNFARAIEKAHGITDER